jgi:hypothetical protein
MIKIKYKNKVGVLICDTNNVIFDSKIYIDILHAIEFFIKQEKEIHLVESFFDNW